MNNEQPNTNWRRVLWFGVLVVVLAYGFGEPYLENWFGIDLPSIRENSNAADVVANNHSNATATNRRSAIDATVSARQESSTATLEKPQTNSKTKTRSKEKTSAEPYLTPTGKKNRLQSPAGLVYGESRGEHRVDHVMRHAVDDKNRPVHSVFNGSKNEILKVIDEAYVLIKAKSPRVRTKPDQRLDFRVEHTVDMQRKVGYLGGQRGRRENYPPRSKLTLILDNGKFMVTAYPDR